LAESCIQSKKHTIGATVTIDSDLTETELLFSETQSRIIVSVAPAQQELFEAFVASSKMDAMQIGTVGGTSLKINTLEIDVEEFNDSYQNTISRIMSK